MPEICPYVYAMHNKQDEERISCKKLHTNWKNSYCARNTNRAF